MRSLTIVLSLAVVATALLVAGCGDSSSSGTTATVPSGSLGAATAAAATAPQRALVLEVGNESPYSARLSDDADPTNAKKEWPYPLGRVGGRAFENFVLSTTAATRTVNVTWKTSLSGGKEVEFKFSATLSCSGTTCTASGRTTSAMPAGLTATYTPSTTKFLHPAPAGGEGALTVSVKPTG